MMRLLVTAGLLALLSACAASPFGATQSSVTVVEPAARAPRLSRDEQLAAFWAQRRQASPAPLLVSSPWAPQNFPESVDSDDQVDLDSRRLERESAATRAAVNGALRR